MRKKDNLTPKDGTLIGVFVVFLILIAISHFKAHHLSNFGGLIEQLTLITLSFVCLVDIANYCSWDILVPDFYTRALRKKSKEKIEEFMSEYFRDDVKFFRHYNEERIQYLLTQLNISAEQLDELRLDLIRMRCMPLSNMDDAKERVKRYVKSGYPMVIGPNDVDSAKLSYTRVRYFINFYDPMFQPNYAGEIAAVLSFLIQEKENLNAVDKLIIPHSSNFLLGVAVGRNLGKPIVKMRRDQGRIEKDKPWEGTLSSMDKVIIIHDVLVTAEQVLDALNKLPSTCFVSGVYCLIVRKEWNGVERLSEKGVNIEYVMSLSDDDIRELRGEE